MFPLSGVLAGTGDLLGMAIDRVAFVFGASSGLNMGELDPREGRQLRAHHYFERSMLTSHCIRVHQKNALVAWVTSSLCSISLACRRNAAHTANKRQAEVTQARGSRFTRELRTLSFSMAKKFQALKQAQEWPLWCVNYHSGHLTSSRSVTN